MSRDSNGNYTLPAGNPVVSGAIITSTWANTTMDDIELALTDSLDRRGRGGMLAAFLFADGDNLLPGAAWANEPTTGLYRDNTGSGDLRLAVLTQDKMRWLEPGNAQVWNSTLSQWEDIVSGATGTVGVPRGTGNGQTLYWDNSGDMEWKATSLLHVDIANSRVGVGVQDPTSNLETAGNIKVRQANAGLFLDAAASNFSVGIFSTDSSSMEVRNNNASGTLLLSVDEVKNTWLLGNSRILWQAETPDTRLFNTLSALDEGGWSTVYNTANSIWRTLTDAGAQGEKYWQVDRTGTQVTLQSWNVAGEVSFAAAAIGIGIGTLNPEARLHVVRVSKSGVTANTSADGIVIDNNANTGMSILTPNNTEGRIWFGDTESNGAGQINYDHVDDTMRLFSAGGERVKLSAIGMSVRGVTPAIDLENQSAAANSGKWSTIASGTSLQHRTLLDTGALGEKYYQINRNLGLVTLQTWYVGNQAIQSMQLSATGTLNLGTGGGAGTVGKLVVNSSALAGNDAVVPAIEVRKNQAATGSGNHYVYFYSGNTVANGAIVGAGAGAVQFGAQSDIALKRNILDLPNTLKDIMSLRPVTFEYKNGSGGNTGFIAQDVERIWPDTVAGKDGSKILGGMDKMTARLVKAIQELTARLEVLENDGSKAY